MVKKETIGKIQLILGILLLIAGIIGLIITLNIYGNFKERFELNYDVQDNNEFSVIASISSFGIIINNALNFGLLFILSIIISLLFITQGLVNMGQRI